MEAISLARLIDSLQAAGLIGRRPHATDRRIRTLWLTEAARAVLARVLTIAAEVHTQALAGIPETEHERLLDLLSAVPTNLESGSDHADSLPDEDVAA